MIYTLVGSDEPLEMTCYRQGGSNQPGPQSGPAQAALSGSHYKAPGSAGGYLLPEATILMLGGKNTTRVVFTDLSARGRQANSPVSSRLAAN